MSNFEGNLFIFDAACFGATSISVFHPYLEGGCYLNLAAMQFACTSFVGAVVPIYSAVFWGCMTCSH